MTGGEGGGNEGRRGADQIGVEGRNRWRGWWGLGSGQTPRLQMIRPYFAATSNLEDPVETKVEPSRAASRSDRKIDGGGCSGRKTQYPNIKLTHYGFCSHFFSSNHKKIKIFS